MPFRSIVFFLLIVFGGALGVTAQKSIPKSARLVVKLQPEQAHFFQSRASQFPYTVAPKFPLHAPVNRDGSSAMNLVDLSLIYEIIPSAESPKNLKETLLQQGVFEYVEWVYDNEIALTVNDPELGNQGYLTQVYAQGAWNFTQGASTVKIGVVDTGTDMDHPDLESKMYTNSADPINGLDDDQDGYIDNYYGWDFVDADNDPQAELSDHGVHVAGTAAAATNNGVGVASLGYQTLFVPIRAGDGKSITHGYEGIIYAADLGCDIINCSWGNFTYSQYAQDVVNYATFNKGALVVAATGNNGLNAKFYPAAYENVLAVGSVNWLDEKSSFTNYGYYVDILAPGENVLSTVDNGIYKKNTGTSMATPVVAAAAALVKARYPHLSPLQITEQLKTTATNVDAQNAAYLNKIGTGRLHAQNAVSEDLITHTSVVWGNTRVSNGMDRVFKAGDTLFLSGTFTNYLAPSGNVQVTISSTSSFVTILNPQLTLGAFTASEQKNIYSNPFQVVVHDTTPVNEKVTLQISITDGSFTNSYFEEFLVNVDYINVLENQISLSIGSKGQFGYNDHNNQQGLGMRLNESTSQLFEGGLLIGYNDNGFKKVLDRVRNTSDYDNDFSATKNITVQSAPNNASFYARGVFNDSVANADSIGLSVTQTTYAYSDGIHQNYVVLTYTLHNNQNTDLVGVHVGLFADFDVNNFAQNMVLTDEQRFTMYTQSTGYNSNLYGVQLLSSGQFNPYAIDNISGGAGGVDPLNSFNSVNKYTTLSTRRSGAGLASPNGNDVIQIVSQKNNTIPANDSITVAFALIAAPNKLLLEQIADSAYFRFAGFLPTAIEPPERPAELVIYPNPASQKIRIQNPGARNQEMRYEIVNAHGSVMLSGKLLAHQQSTMVNVIALKSGVYMVRCWDGNQMYVTKLVKKL